MYRINFLHSWQINYIAMSNAELLSNQMYDQGVCDHPLSSQTGRRIDGMTYGQTISLQHSYCIMKSSRFVFVHMNYIH